VVILAGAVTRRPIAPVGDEAQRSLHGDDLLRRAKGRWTHGITIRARPPEIWPWLAQMGCRRAGWYSYDGLDNGGIRSAQRIVADLQEVAVDDIFPWTPTANDGFFVRAVDPGRALVLGGDAGGRYRVTWAFVLDPIDDGRTRLISRASGEHDGFATGLMLRLVMRPIDFGMQRRQLLNIKCRAEASSRKRP
jgi:hypothetical protein